MLHGNTLGLKVRSVRRLERLYRRRVMPQQVVSPELAREMTELSAGIGRQVGVLLNRRGQVEAVAVGDATSIEVPEFGRQRAGSSRFRGLRLVHTHLKGESLTQDDLNDLAKLRLDMMVAIGIDRNGLPGPVYMGHLIPERPDRPEDQSALWETLSPQSVHHLAVDFEELIEALEEEFARSTRARASGGRNRAVLVGVSSGPRRDLEESVSELRELARTAGVTVLDTIVQTRKKLDPRTVLGKGKLQELDLKAMQLGAEMIIFDRDLSPAQVNAIAEWTELRVLDRAQLILDIFAQRATSRDGKLQVELAQLRYRLPRLRGRGDAMSRLAGGIGGRGPGETKLEVDRRRTRERIHRLEKELDSIAVHRGVQRKQRIRRGLPVMSIIGYTNAGKSTLLAALTGTSAYSDDLLFATLDPSSRRLRFPREREVIVTDTVGFIRDLPEDLVAAFRATLEELHDAGLLLQVVDASEPRFEERVEAVERILQELNLLDVPRLLVFNKTDRLEDGPEAREDLESLCRFWNAVPVSALTGRGLEHLVARADEILFNGPARERLAAEHPLS